MALLFKSKNKVSPNSVNKFLTPVATMVLLAISHVNLAIANQGIEFNTDILDLKDRQNISLSEFSRAGYIMPRTYPFYISLNGNVLSTIYDIEYMAVNGDDTVTVPCLTPELIEHIALRSEWQKKVNYTNDDQCLNIESIPGMTVSGSLAKETIAITVP